MTDFTYRDWGLFTSLYPETEEARGVWNAEIGPKTDGTGKVLTVEFPLVRAQLEAAGYTIEAA